MTEIKLSTEDHDIDDLIRYLDGDHHMSVFDRTRVVAAIKAQLPKPAIEEPLAFASVVKVRSGTLYVRLGAVQALPWGSGEQMRSWGQLDVAEVLRIGVGDTERPDVAPEETDDYKLGVSDTTYDILTKLRVLRSEAITSERKNAYDVAIATVEAMQP